MQKHSMKNVKLYASFSVGFGFLEFTTTFNMADNIFWWFICEKQSLSVNQNLAMKICFSWGLVRNNKNYSPIFHYHRRCRLRRSSLWVLLKRTIIMYVIEILKGVLCILLFRLFINSRILHKRNDIKNKVFSIRIKLQSVIEKTLYLAAIYEGERWWKNDYDQINVKW